MLVGVVGVVGVVGGGVARCEEASEQRVVAARHVRLVRGRARARVSTCSLLLVRGRARARLTRRCGGEKGEFVKTTTASSCEISWQSTTRYRTEGGIVYGLAGGAVHTSQHNILLFRGFLPRYCTCGTSGK